MRRFENPRFIEMKKAGKTHKEIGAEFGVSHQTVDGWATEAIRAGLLVKMTGRPKAEHDEQEVNTLLSMWTKGVHISEVQKVLGRPLAAIKKMLAVHGPKERRAPVRRAGPVESELAEQVRSLKDDGKTDVQIGKVLGRNQSWVARVRRKYDIGSLSPVQPVNLKTWSEDEEAELKRLWPSGLSCFLIGQQIGRSEGQVGSKAKRMGLPPKGVPKVRKAADRTYDTVAAAAKARAGTTMKPRPKAGPKEDSNVIPLTARPWLTRERGECSYPYGPRGEIHSCCLPVWNDTNQCESHYALCHDLDRQKRRA